MLSLDPTVGRKEDWDLIIRWRKTIKENRKVILNKPAIQFMEYLATKYDFKGVNSLCNLEQEFNKGINNETND